MIKLQTSQPLVLDSLQCIRNNMTSKSVTLRSKGKYGTSNQQT